MHLHFEPPPVYFMHIPKTGGVTLGHWLRHAYGRGYFDLDLPQIVRLSGQDVRSFRCYHAWHHGRSLFEWLQRPDLAIMTILRDPIERVVSAFNHHQRAHAAHPDRFTAERQARMLHLVHGEFQDHLADPLVTKGLSNGQSRVLGIRKDYAAFFARVVQATPEQRAEALLRPYSVPIMMNADDLPLLATNAHAWLDEMAVIGLTERYAESLLLIADLLGIPVPPELPRANVNPQRRDPAMRYRDQLAPAVVAQLEELNRYDMELYAHATDLFEQQWARYQGRPRHVYSIAPRLRISLRQTASGLKGWLRHTWPGLTEGVENWRTTYRSQQKQEDRRP